MSRFRLWSAVAVAVIWAAVCGQTFAGEVSGDLRRGHPITITFNGPQTSETADPNPFRDYRLNVIFTVGSSAAIEVPGYFAGDGNAAESSSEKGDKWRVHFLPPIEGEYHYIASFRTGNDLAMSLDPKAGKPTDFDGEKGSFKVAPADPKAPGFLGKGRLRWVGKHHLMFADSGKWYLKTGADSPENFLGYFEFDGTAPSGAKEAIAGKPRKGESELPKKLHRYEPHAKDWKTGDPMWQGGKGKNIIGALNYLASKGVNSVYFLTMNVGGDGKDVWPWTTSDERFRYDVSKLAQWEIVFSHMDRLGMMLHVVTQETENDQLLDKGELGPERMLYYRELVARFSHHPAITWNLGEENTNTSDQLKAFSKYIHDLDPYDHPVVVHTFPGKQEAVYRPLLGHPFLEGPSLQIGNMRQTHAETVKWVEESEKAGRPWYVCLDEIGGAETGVKPDADDPDHDQVRKEPLWGNLMGGGGGVEWYFGYKFAHNDLNLEDFRSRDRMWDQTRWAREFFEQNLPFAEMKPADALTENKDDYVFAKPGEVYAVYLPNGGSAKLDLGTAAGEFAVQWFNPRTGGALQKGSVEKVSGPGVKELGNPPADPGKDWAILVKKQ